MFFEETFREEGLRPLRLSVSATEYLQFRITPQ